MEALGLLTETANLVNATGLQVKHGRVFMVPSGKVTCSAYTHIYSSEHWEIHFLQDTRKTRPGLTGM